MFPLACPLSIDLAAFAYIPKHIHGFYTSRIKLSEPRYLGDTVLIPINAHSNQVEALRAVTYRASADHLKEKATGELVPTHDYRT